MTTLPEFLLARIADDEAVARAAAVLRYDFLDFAGHVLSSDRDATPAMDEHVDRWDPARVLAECQAKRQIIALEDRGYDMEQALRSLAAVYADHPDYREEWRP